MDDPLAGLRVRFLARTRDDLARLEAIGDDPTQRAEVQALVHRLAGAAGTLGFASISAQAKVIDAAFSDAAAGADVDLSALLSLLRDLPSP